MPESETRSPTPRAHVFWGVLAMAAALGEAALLSRHLDELQGPAWAAYSTVAIVFLGGVWLLALAAGRRMVQSLIQVAIMVAMTLPAAWVAWGGGVRHCKASGPLSILAGEQGCRVAFGIGAVVCLFILLLAVVDMVRVWMRRG
jgi:hypothetical protein